METTNNSTESSSSQPQESAHNNPQTSSSNEPEDTLSKDLSTEQSSSSNSSKTEQQNSPSRSSAQNTPSKGSTSRSKLEPIDALSVGLLSEFTCLKDLESQLEQIVNNQRNLIENISSMSNFYTQNEELMEVQLMMKKMNLYRMKLKKIKSDMLYIRSSTQSLLQKSIDIQNIKVNQKADQVRRFDYEIGLIAKSKQNS